MSGAEEQQDGREQLELAVTNMHIRLEVALCSILLYLVDRVTRLPLWLNAFQSMEHNAMVWLPKETCSEHDTLVKDAIAGKPALLLQVMLLIMLDA